MKYLEIMGMKTHGEHELINQAIELCNNLDNFKIAPDGCAQIEALATTQLSTRKAS